MCGTASAAVALLRRRFKPSYAIPPSLDPSVRRCRKSWALEKEESTFIDWQRAKVQETTDEVSFSRQLKIARALALAAMHAQGVRGSQQEACPA